MRVYTRGVDEGLVIGESVQINVLEIQTDCVRLAIIDPEASPTYREELLYFPHKVGGREFEMDANSIFSHDGFRFEDEDSRLIPMA